MVEISPNEGGQIGHLFLVLSVNLLGVLIFENIQTYMSTFNYE